MVDTFILMNTSTFMFHRKEARSMEGLSARSIVMNCVSQFIIFLYLCDNDTSWMILFSAGIGVVIEVRRGGC